ncbi:MAG: citrate synthase, partial [Frankiaceae bacterium]|nr:citrate synthase [Frankiaceae bacterium]
MTNFQLNYDDGVEELPAVEGTDKPFGFDVRKLLADTGQVTFDPGFANTAACKSDICFIDGGAGILRYRGYPIDQLAGKASFLEVSYLLIYGELPTQEQVDAFAGRIREHTLLHEDFKGFFNG